MIDVKYEIQAALLRQGLSMTKMTKRMKSDGILNISVNSLSRMLKMKTIRFETVQEILNYLGYEIEIKRKSGPI